MEDSQSPEAARGPVARFLLARPRLFLATFSLLVFLPGLGSHDLWNPDEPRYAEVTREMLASGSFFVPTLNGAIYTHKPPVMFWAMAISSLFVGGLNETAVRLPSALGAVAIVLLIHGIGRRLFGEWEALISGLAFATFALTLWQARTGQIDMLLCLFVTSTAYCWVRALEETRPALYLFGFALAGVGTVTKGPVSLLPVLFAFVAFHLIFGDRAELKRMRIGWGLLIWAAVVLAWLLPAGLSAGGSYFHELIVTQNLTRYTAGASYGGTSGHLHPWYYYPTVLLPELLPWSLLIPGAAVALWKDGSASQRRSARLVATWAVVTILFFSLSAAKRGVYMVQMFPAVALLLGGGLVPLFGSKRRTGLWLGIPLWAFAVLLGLVATAVVVVAPDQPEVEVLSSTLPPLLAAALGVIAVTTAVSAWLASRRRLAGFCLWLAGGLGLMFSLVAWIALPLVDPIKSVRPVAERYVELSDPEEPYAFFPGQEAALQFYTERLGREIRSEAEVHEFVAQGGSERGGRVWLFAESDALEDLERPIQAREVARGVDPKNGYVLFVSGAAPPTSP